MRIEIEHTNDSGILAEICRTAQNIHSKAYPNLFKQYNFKAFKKYMYEVVNRDNWNALLAKIDNTPVGYVLFCIRQYHENPFRFCYKAIRIEQICVVEEQQHNGVGTALMNEVEAFAMKEDADHMELTYWDNNTHAKHFYNKLGFSEGMHFIMKQLKP